MKAIMDVFFPKRNISLGIKIRETTRGSVSEEGVVKNHGGREWRQYDREREHDKADVWGEWYWGRTSYADSREEAMVLFSPYS